MGLFQQRREDQNQWAAIPGETLDEDPSDFLSDVPPSDLLGLGVTSVTIPIDPALDEGETDTATS